MKKFSKRINEDNSIQMYKYSMSVDVEGSVLSTTEGDAGEIVDQIVDEMGGVNDTIKIVNYEINTIDVIENGNSYSEIEESNKRVVIKENIEKSYFYNKIVELENKIGQLQYEISLLEHSEEELTGVTNRTEELKELVKNLSNYNQTVELENKIGQLQYEISLLEHSEEELIGVTNRTEELKELVKNLSIPTHINGVVDESNDTQTYFYNQTVELEGEINANSEDEAVNKINNINAFEISGALRGVTIANTKVTHISGVVDESNKRVVIKENNGILNNLDMDVNQHLMSITSNGKNMGNVGIKDGKIVTDGFIGYNEYTNFVNLIHGLQGHGIAIDDFYF